MNTRSSVAFRTERTTRAPPPIEASGATHVGRVRKQNQDSYLIATLRRSIVVHDATLEARSGWFTGEPAGTLVVVADGMGGEKGGDVASRVAVQTIADYLLNAMPWTPRRTDVTASRAPSASLPGLRAELSSALVTGDLTVRNTGIRTGAPRMGTTLTMAFVIWPMVYVAHVGDSRCYLCRAGSLKRLTTDHNLAQQMLDEGVSVQLNASWQHLLWNSLGGSAEAPAPQITKLTLEPSDVLLLCSDGLTKHVSDAEIAGILPSNASAPRICSTLIERANDQGGSDNVTAVVVRIPRGA
jgi:protein phosphatase